jgi:hypothetical protein
MAVSGSARPRASPANTEASGLSGQPESLADAICGEFDAMSGSAGVLRIEG